MLHYKQSFNYLKTFNIKLGILVNFNTEKILNSIKRIGSINLKLGIYVLSMSK